MIGIALKTSEDRTELLATIDTLVLGESLDKSELEQFVADSEYSDYVISANLIHELSEAVANAANEGNVDEITLPIAHRPVSVKITIAPDEMSATLRVEAPNSGHLPSAKEIILQANELGIKRGLSVKRIKNLLQVTIDSKPGSRHEDIIAKGLPPKKGKDSQIKPLVPNALERVLAPTEIDGNRVDMRDLGDILCVNKDQKVAQRARPTLGRTGYTITNKALIAEVGEWRDIKLGENTYVSSDEPNIILASVPGQPKFNDGVMSVDDTFVAKGVNVASGNIKYHGAVIVNGDVTEHMQISADGDVTINGFVESAKIRSGGDIIITQGASGKMHEEDCQLIAKGNIYIEHGQGLNIIAGKNVTIGRQLAYSQAKCRGSVTVGKGDVPMGNLFASNIKCYQTVTAGSVGAISGSELSIDFSDGFNLFNDRLESLMELHKNLNSQNVDHEYKTKLLSHKHIPDHLKSKVAELNDQLEAERDLLKWLSASITEINLCSQSL